MISEFARKFGTVQVGYGFECEKNNGNTYSGEIVKIGAYPKGTLVTVRFYNEYGPVYKSIYLEDCVVWYSEEPSPV
jgi:hypothetical protein